MTDQIEELILTDILHDVCPVTLDGCGGDLFIEDEVVTLEGIERTYICTKCENVYKATFLFLQVEKNNKEEYQKSYDNLEEYYGTEE